MADIAGESKDGSNRALFCRTEGQLTYLWIHRPGAPESDGREIWVRTADLMAELRRDVLPNDTRRS